MKTILLGLLAETAIHPGTGRSGGVIDLPVAREAATDYPFIAGSSLKGAFRDKMETSLENGKELAKKWFGKPDTAGEVLVSDARLLLLPVRSLTGSYRWLTCPHIVERLCRDTRRAGLPFDASVPEVAKATVHTSGTGRIYLEEREFEIAAQKPDDKLIELFGSLTPHKTTRGRIDKTLAIVSDDDFAWFARYALPVQARNQLDDETKQSKNLWYSESLPADTLMYTVVAGRNNAAEETLKSLFENDAYIQVGGNETVGAGWFSVAFRNGSEGQR